MILLGITFICSFISIFITHILKRRKIIIITIVDIELLTLIYPESRYKVGKGLISFYLFIFHLQAKCECSYLVTNGLG